MTTFVRPLLILLLAALATACGQMGALYIPDPANPTAVPGAATPPPAASAQAPEQNPLKPETAPLQVP